MLPRDSLVIGSPFPRGADRPLRSRNEIDTASLSELCQNPLLASSTARSPYWRARPTCYSLAVRLDPRIRDAFRAFGRIGGKKGGPKGGASRMAKLSPAERRVLAKKAAKARWQKGK
jgi:hypothetical protein